MPDRFSWPRYVATAASLALAALRDGRLPLSPSRWLLDLRHLRGVMATPHEASPPPPGSTGRDPDWKERLARSSRTLLEAFLASGARLPFVHAVHPQVSVILVLFNHAELTLRCLRSLLEQALPVELVVVDNASSDETARLLSRVDGATIIRSSENVGFLRGSNLAAAAATGEYLLFLNNDAELLPGSLASALRTAGRSARVGAVGGRILLHDGSLQEAGSILWRDGSCSGYGRGDSPELPEYQFVRDVDFCSAALLLTPRRLFLDLGGFDERFAPAYYEDVDYCVRLWQSGRRVVYDPRTVALHVEFASAPSAAAAVAQQMAGREALCAKHLQWLQDQPDRESAGMLAARSRPGHGLRVLLVDDRTPHMSAGFGFPRAAEIIRALDDLGHMVTLYPTSLVGEDWHAAYLDIPASVEVMLGWGPGRLKQFWQERASLYDCVIVSRAHNMRLLRARLGSPSRWGPPVLYDAEAIEAIRDEGRRRLAGRPAADEEVQQLVDAELALADGVAGIWSVSDSERRRFESARGVAVHIVGHAVEPRLGRRSWADRGGLLFVGAFHELSPNTDAVLWFVREVLPRVRARLPRAHLTIVGQDPPREVSDIDVPDVEVVAGTVDLEPFYDRARVFVAPTRFAAGIPIKVIHAAAHGIPVVCTPLLAGQLGWVDGGELLAADTAAGFADACVSLLTSRDRWEVMREGALRRIRSEYSRERLRSSLDTALASVIAGADYGRTHLASSARIGRVHRQVLEA
jgi:GT2 family glycosyltransferase/glycosyltransferase involved in cell wall biosynthesis